ncbi:MAG: restriction endonuclease subunit S [Rhodoferax sp.]|uniref:restriction endonuclease subunit S n=1 Tax=Rhodoferax sp. TaxID=50421 RepID=UPI00260E5507|nr:restriction endonuclease subunit S [Rhodoferax sp.]MDD2882973.1 restriction endonuclease subunit S [Rhodoferax sp.]
MSSEWRTQKLGDIFELINGYAFKGSEFQNSGVPVFKIKNVKPNQILLDDLAYVAEEVAKKRPDKQVLRGDILITMSGNRMDGSKDTWVGKVAYFDLPGRYLLNQRVGILRPRSGVQVDRKCCAYFLSSEDYQHFFISVATSSGGQANLSPSQILNEEFRLPAIDEQEKISALLGALDDRIALLHETSATLEAIAQALFKSWFIDFDPVRAKSEGRAPESMDEATAALLPDGFEESELGLVPKEWRVQSLDTIATFLNGLALQKFPPTGIDDLPVIKIAQLRKGDTVGADQASRDIKPEYIVKNGDVLFSWSGSLEVEIWCGGEGALNQHLFKVTSADFPKWFYFFWTRHHLADFRQTAASKATTMGHIQRGHLTAAKVCIPNKEAMKAATSILGPIVEKLIANSLQARTLTNIRDSLLPKLISGKLVLSQESSVAS